MGGNLCDKNATVINVRSKYNARQGLSIIELEQGTFINCEFSETGNTSYGVFAPGAGVDVETEFPMSNRVGGDLKFINCKFENNAGQGGFTGGQEYSTGTFVGCKFDHQANDFGILTNFAKGTFLNCEINVRRIYPGLYSPIIPGTSLAASTSLRDCVIRSKGAGIFLASEQNNLLVENCFLICEWTDRTAGYFPYIQSGTAILRNNVVTYPTAIYNGTPTSNTYDIIGLWGAKISEQNEFKVDGSLTGNQHFAIAYYNSTVTKDKFISGSYIRSNYNSSWDNAIPFSKNDGTAISALAIPAYLNNAAAIAAGLSKGSIYRSDAGELKVVF